MSSDDTGLLAARIGDHLRDCEDCRLAPPETEVLARILARAEVGPDAAALSALTLARAGAELTARAGAVFRRQLLVVLLLAFIPLPGMLIFGLYGLRLAYAATATVLPAGVASYLAVSYGLSALVVLTASYATIPLLLERLRARPAARVSYS